LIKNTRENKIIVVVWTALLRLEVRQGNARHDTITQSQLNIGSYLVLFLKMEKFQLNFAIVIKIHQSWYFFSMYLCVTVCLKLGFTNSRMNTFHVNDTFFYLMSYNIYTIGYIVYTLNFTRVLIGSSRCLYSQNPIFYNVKVYYVWFMENKIHEKSNQMTINI